MPDTRSDPYQVENTLVIVALLPRLKGRRLAKLDSSVACYLLFSGIAEL
jgi:hypothetical protein